MPEVVDSSRLWTKALKKNYGSRQVVGGVDISIKSGSVIGLLGPKQFRRVNAACRYILTSERRRLSYVRREGRGDFILLGKQL